MNYQRISLGLKKLEKFIFDIIFPVECLGCGKEGLWLCEDCFKKINLVDELNCPICNKKSPWGKVCPACQGDSFLDGVLVSASYNQELLKKLIHTYKYNFIPDLSIPLGQLLNIFLKQIFEFKNKKTASLLAEGLDNYKLQQVLNLPQVLINSREILLIPVPLHKKRLKERGFNQAELLALELEKYFGFKAESGVLERRRYTTAQVDLGGSDRKLNVKDAFDCFAGEKIKDQKIILIDDVFTTGATMQECAKILKRAGAREVYGLVLARG